MSSSERSPPDPAEPFETWFLERVARAVEARDVSANLLTDLRAEMAEAHGRPSDEWHTLAVQELAERFDLSVDRLTELLAALEAQLSVTREAFLRRFVEAWLMQQRDAYEANHNGGDNG